MKHKQILAWILTISLSITLVPDFMVTADAAHETAQMSIVNKADGDSVAVEATMGDGETVTFIVEVEGDPLAAELGISSISDTEKTNELLAEQQMVMSRINSRVDTDAKKGFVYTAVFNGFSMEGTIDQLDEIKALDGVKNVYISSEIPAIEPVSSDGIMPMLEASVELINAPYAYDSGYNGEGTVIAIIDLGCDTSHDFFAAAPENPRYSKSDIDALVKTALLNADVSSANQVYKNEKIPFAYNYSTKSADTYIHSVEHGTHVAGIAAGKNGASIDGTAFSGVAPEAQLLIMSCMNENQVFSTAAVLAALNDAVLLGADVVNMSFGADYTDTGCDDLLTDVLANTRRAGVSLVAANGNAARGYNSDTPRTDRPDYSAAGIPSGYETTTAVASANNTHIVSEYYALESLDGTGYRAYTAHADNPVADAFEGVEYLEYEHCGLGYPADFANVNVQGRLALVKRGELTFTDKAKNAKAAGAAGIIIYNTSEDLFGCADPLGLPAAAVTLSTGEALAGRADKRLVYKGQMTVAEENVSPGEISYYSFWGVDSTLQLKPEITAPGGKIYSSVPDNKYKSISGTSMAAPHMAGVSAISRQYYRTNPFLEQFNGKTGEEMVLLLENISMNSADIIRQKNGVPCSPRVQGAGLVNMEGIIKSPVLLYGDSGKAKLSLGDELADALDIKFDIVNISKEPVSFDNISVEVLTDGYTEGEQGYIVDEAVYIPVVSQSVPENVTVASGETYSFGATVKLDKEFLAANSEIFTNGFYIDGYVILDTDDSSVKASIPFTGFCGDWGKAPVFDSTIYDEGGSCLIDPAADGETGTYVAAAILQDHMTLEIATLGRNPISPEIVDKKYIAFSSDAGYFLELVTTNFRAVDALKVSLENAQGERIYTDEVNTVLSKFIPISYVFTDEEIQSIQEGAHNIVIEASVAGDTEATDTLTIPVTVDNTFPEILSAVYDSESKTVTVTARENHYFAYFYAEYIDGDGNTDFECMAVYDEDYSDGCVTKTIDVSNMADASTLKIGCVDYAMNGTWYAIDYFSSKLGAELVDTVRIDGMTKAELNVRNNTDQELNGDLVLAFYDAEGSMVAVDTKPCSVRADDTAAISYALFEDTQDAEYVKLFVWDINSLRPLDVHKEFTLTE